MRVEQKDYIGNSLGRIVVVVALLAVQIWFLVTLVTRLGSAFTYYAELEKIAVLAAVLYIYGRHRNSAVKLPWIILILTVPVIGIVMFLLTDGSLPRARIRRRFNTYEAEMPRLLPQDTAARDRLAKKDRSLGNQADYLIRRAHFPVYQNTDVQYFAEASDAFEAQLEDLKKAEKFIFLEYFAIENRSSFARMKEILYERAAAGVDVRVLYDDVGSIAFLSGSFQKQLEAHGIRCKDFNPVVPFLNIFMNNRDHRKMMIVDGKIGYTGGYNLANEYFNVTHPYGYWKDTGVRLEGEAVHTLTASFLELWNAMSNTREQRKDRSLFQLDIENCLIDAYIRRLLDGGTGKTDEGGSFVQPYADSPLDEEHTAANVYMNIINSAERYVWICTPYLVISDEMSKVLTLAAGRGVDVRIVTPGIPDKKLVYQLTRSYYAVLVRSGVRIYEYTPGFNHAKMVVSDDRVATVGTVNMDFRSMMLHFEDGVVFYGGDVIGDVKKDFEENLFAVSADVSDIYRSRPTYLRVGQCLLRFIAPLL